MALKISLLMVRAAAVALFLAPVTFDPSDAADASLARRKPQRPTQQQCLNNYVDCYVGCDRLYPVGTPNNNGCTRVCDIQLYGCMKRAPDRRQRRKR